MSPDLPSQSSGEEKTSRWSWRHRGGLSRNKQRRRVSLRRDVALGARVPGRAPAARVGAAVVAAAAGGDRPRGVVGRGGVREKLADPRKDFQDCTWKSLLFTQRATEGPTEEPRKQMRPV